MFINYFDNYIATATIQNPNVQSLINNTQLFQVTAPPNSAPPVSVLELDVDMQDIEDIPVISRQSQVQH